MENGISQSRFFLSAVALKRKVTKVTPKYSLIGFIGFVIGALALTALQARAETKLMPDYQAPFIPGEVIVKYKDPVAAASAQSAQSGRTSKSMKNVALYAKLANQISTTDPFMTDPSLALVKLRSLDPSAVKTTIELLHQDPAVEFAEPNYIVHILGNNDPVVPNDPDFGKLWGLKNLGQADSAGKMGIAGSDINVGPIWSMGYTGSRNIVVAVIDTGVDWDHPDLKDNLFTNTAEIPGNGKDDDGNGFVDDVHGFNFFEHNADSRDKDEHGTHCSGTIGGVGNNGVGVAGVNWQVSILPVKFIGPKGGSTSSAIESVNYARLMKVNVMSNSWGGGGPSQALYDAIKAAGEEGIGFIAAAGNDGRNNDSLASFPSNYDLPNIISVAATDNRDTLATFSNYGAKKVHVAAPGVRIYSSVPGEKMYDNFSGTSMATPHVSGIYALLQSIHPEWGFTEIKDRLIRTSDPINTLRKKVVAKGRVNAYNALTGTVPPSNDPKDSDWVKIARVIESDHPYKNGTRSKITISEPGAKALRVFFEKISTETGFDRIFLTAPSGQVIDQFEGENSNVASEYIRGDQMNLIFVTDSTNNGFGYRITEVQVIK